MAAQREIERIGEFLSRGADIQTEHDEAICALYETMQRQQIETDELLTALYEATLGE